VRGVRRAARLRNRIRDDASVLLALCPDTAAIVSNWKLVDKMWDV
jgi:hypothetical protein